MNFRLIYPCPPTAHEPFLCNFFRLPYEVGYIYLEFESQITFAVSNPSARSTKENISSSCPSLEDRITRPVKMIQRPESCLTILLLWREEWITKLFMPPIFFKSDTRIAPNESPWYHPPGRQDIYWRKFVVIWVGTWCAETCMKSLAEMATGWEGWICALASRCTNDLYYDIYVYLVHTKIWANPKHMTSNESTDLYKQE